MREIERELGKGRHLYRKEKRLLERVEALRLSLLPCGIRYDRDKVQNSPSDQMTETMAKIDDVERELLEVGEELTHWQAYFGKMTLILPPKERYGLRQFYLSGKTAQDISDAMRITRRHVFRLKNNGISMLERGNE